ncbi:hypothetical protein ACWGST_03015 [Agromyces sp. NPDC055520]
MRSVALPVAALVIVALAGCTSAPSFDDMRGAFPGQSDESLNDLALTVCLLLENVNDDSAEASKLLVSEVKVTHEQAGVVVGYAAAEVCER